MLSICYYPDGVRGPVGKYLERLANGRPKAFARLVLDLEVLGAEGLRSRAVTVRHLGGKLWELKRFYDGVHYRLFFGVVGRHIWLVHALEKKSARTPVSDLSLAAKRLREVMQAYE